MSAVPRVDLQRTIRRWDNWRRLTESVVWIPRGLFLGIIIGLTVAIISRMRPWLIRDEIIMVTAVASVIGLSLSLLGVWLYPRSMVWLVRYFDRKFELKERVSTAFELSTGRIPPAYDLGELQFQDTEKTIAGVKPSDYLPLKFRWAEWAVLLVGFIMLVLLLMMDNSYETQIINQRELEQALAEQTEELENTREEIASNENLSEAERQELLQPIDEALETLQEPEVSREEAVAALSEAEKELRDQADGFDEEQEGAFEEAGERLSEAEAGEEAGEALSESDLQEAAEQLSELGEDAANGEMTPEQMQELAETLEQAADALQESNPEAAEAMREAAEALRNGDMEAAQQALNEAAEALEQQQQAAEQTEQAQSAQQGAQQLQQSAQEIAQSGDQQPQDSGNEGTEAGQQNQPQGQQPQGQQQAVGEQSEEGQVGQQGPPQNQQGSQGQAGQEGQQSNQEGGQDTNQGGSQSEGDNPSASQVQVPGQESAGTQAGDTPGGQGNDTTTGDENTQSSTADNNPDASNDSLIQDYDSVFAPSSRLDGQEDRVTVDGQPEGDDFVDEQETDFNDTFEGDSRITYDRVYADYANSVNEALDTDYIPIGLKDVIRTYFSSLEP